MRQSNTAGAGGMAFTLVGGGRGKAMTEAQWLASTDPRPMRFVAAEMLKRFK